MACKSCGNELIGSVKVRGGHICRHCYDSLPESVKVNIRHFTADQVKQIRGLVREPEGEEILARCGEFKVSRSGIQLNGKVFPLEHLSGVRLNFHPAAPGLSSNTVSGTATVVIDTKAPRCMFEEPFISGDVSVGYHIIGRNITYEFPRRVELLFHYIEKCLRDGSRDLTSYIEAYVRAAGDGEKNSTTGSGEASGGGTGDGQTRRPGPEERPRTELEMAEELFGMTPPYTKDEARDIRNKLLKKHHPDVGGSEEMTKKINAAYELLVEHAT